MKRKTNGKFFISFLILVVMVFFVCAVVSAEGTDYAASAANAQKSDASLQTGHRHSALCYDVNGELICGETEATGHLHNEACYDENNNLICSLSSTSSDAPAGEEHRHTEACRDETGALICGDLSSEESNLPLALASATPASEEGTEPVPTSPEGEILDLGLSNIYPGKQVGDTWVAMDGSDEASANVNATVKLPADVTAPEGYSLFIRKIERDEKYYPKEDAVLAEAGTVVNGERKLNGYQCYIIRWVKIEENTDGTITYHTLPLTWYQGRAAAEVTIEYLKTGAELSGRPGARKLLIYNSNKDGTLQDQVADTVENVQVSGTGYKSFTFQAAHAGPYVFVSKFLEQGYIEQLAISEVIDGSAPFDGNNDPGNDNGKDNRIVRSYDTIQYNLAATFGARQEAVTAGTVNMYFELTLRKSAAAAKFDISKMGWLKENYSVEYLDASGNVIMIMAHDGKYYQPQEDSTGAVKRDVHGFALPDSDKKVSLNAALNGSTKEGNSYKVTSGGVAMQRLVGCTTLTADEGKNILSGTQSFPMAVQVRNADNDETFAPTFRMWLEGNEENYGPETTFPDGTMAPAQPDTDNVINISKDENKKYQVKVSAGTNFNLQLKKNTDMSYKNWFDFSTGQAVTEDTRDRLEELAKLERNHGKSNPAKFVDENGQELDVNTKAAYANYRYGRITCYGITLQLYNDTDNNPKENRTAKGMKGISLPVGDITFDLNFYSEATSNVADNLDPSEYTAILWDYNENLPANNPYTYNKYVDPGRGTVEMLGDGKGNGGRNIYWDGETRSPYAKGGAPSNYIFYHKGCYYGGEWAMTNDNGEKVNDINTIASPKVVKETGANTTYHFSVSDYDFDFDNQHFPDQDAGNSGKVEGYDTYARCFSAGCVQVLSVFPRVQKVNEAEIFLNAEVSNLHLKTRAKQELTAQEDDPSKIQHEVNTGDNKKRDQIVLYAPGNLTKGSSFNGKNKDKDPENTNEGFLGTQYWTTSYDCSTFAGDDIWIVSYGMIAAGSDYRMRSMNLLQLFDSRALSIREKPDVCQDFDPEFDIKGDATFLYAMDPEYPDGYDTNQKDVLKYMNSVREEDLVYSSEMPNANGDITVGNMTGKCVGVLMELRGCDLLGGKYQYMRTPVKVNGEDPKLVSKTVATVNTFRVWSWDIGANMTWANGKWNSETGENMLKGFFKPDNKYNAEGYSGELANRPSGSPPHYVKTEYEDGLQKKGTHAGGTLAGNSLLILSYKAGINIGVDNKESSSMISYDLGKGESVVDYRLKNIKTEISDHTGQTQSPLTTLTINAVLDEGYTGKNQRISVSGGSYRILGYAVDAAGTVASEETSIAIGTDPKNPTMLEFIGSDGNRHRIRVYAQPGPNDQSVKFVIQNAPVGLVLPDITFQANFAGGTALNNSDTVKTSAYISGQGDNRAYDQAKGNTDNITVGIIKLSGTNLTKAVNHRYIELNGTIQYDVIYTNSGTETIEKIYFYDLLPQKGDIRGSDYEGNVVLRAFDVKSGAEANDRPTATVYYSELPYRTLYDKVKVFGGTETDGSISGMNADKVEEMLNNSTDFKQLGKFNSNTGKFEYDIAFEDMTDDKKTEEMSKITGLYLKVENLRQGQTIDLSFKIQSQGNEAGDWYKNIANSWIAESATLPLTSNKVETQAVSRRISGVVWYDWNLNGVRDVGATREMLLNGVQDNDFVKEKLLKGVTVTLFKKNEKGTYEECKEDVTGGMIEPIVTGNDGAYSFDKLPAGNYIVAFSGEALEHYTGATIYQKNKVNDDQTNDGKAISNLEKLEKEVKGIELDKYAYFISYTDDSAPMELHKIEDMGSVLLQNGVEAFDHQDLGVVVAGYKLPETGGSGSLPYTAGGILLLMAALAVWSFTCRHRYTSKK